MTDIRFHPIFNLFDVKLDYTERSSASFSNLPSLASSMVIVLSTGFSFTIGQAKIMAILDPRCCLSYSYYPPILTANMNCGFSAATLLLKPIYTIRSDQSSERSRFDEYSYCTEVPIIQNYIGNQLHLEVCGFISLLKVADNYSFVVKQLKAATANKASTPGTSQRPGSIGELLIHLRGKCMQNSF